MNEDKRASKSNNGFQASVDGLDVLGDDDYDNELPYGPGIVAKLRTRFLQYSVKREPTSVSPASFPGASNGSSVSPLIQGSSASVNCTTNLGSLQTHGYMKRRCSSNGNNGSLNGGPPIKPVANVKPIQLQSAEQQQVNNSYRSHQWKSGRSMTIENSCMNNLHSKDGDLKLDIVPRSGKCATLSANSNLNFNSDDKQNNSHDQRTANHSDLNNGRINFIKKSTSSHSSIKYRSEVDSSSHLRKNHEFLSRSVIQNQGNSSDSLGETKSSLHPRAFKKSESVESIPISTTTIETSHTHPNKLISSNSSFPTASVGASGSHHNSRLDQNKANEVQNDHSNEDSRWLKNSAHNDSVDSNGDRVDHQCLSASSISSRSSLNKWGDNSIVKHKASNSLGGGSTMIFDFRGKNVRANVAVLSPPMNVDFRSPCGNSEDDDTHGRDSSPEIISETFHPSGIVFIGENVIAGRSSLLIRRNKKLTTHFDDDIETFEYPSESSYSDSPDSVSHYQESQMNDDCPKVSTSERRSDLARIMEPSSNLTRNYPNALPGLASYKPALLSSESGFGTDSGGVFELGVSRITKQGDKRKEQNSENELSSPDRDENAFTLKPADSNEITSWSTSSTALDLLF